MTPLSYRQLRDHLSTLTEDQLDCEVLVYLVQTEEAYPIMGITEVQPGDGPEDHPDVDGACRVGHPYLFHDMIVD